MTSEANPPAGRLHQTLLITDIVRSTEHLAQLGDLRWRELLEQHDATVYEHVQAAGGRILADRGDGFLIAFETSGPAVACAEQLCLATVALGVQLRAGVHEGECELLGERLAGMAIHIAARIGALARGSEVLVSAAVREPLEGSGLEFLDRGVHQLRGVPGEWDVYALRSKQLAAAAEPVALETQEIFQVPLPALAAARRKEVRMVDRVRELERCVSTFERVRTGEPRTIFITGEPGIGKTRLAAEVAGALHAAGATVLCGRCDPELGVPYQPFVEVLTHYARFAPPELLAQHRAQYGHELSRLVPELSGSAAPLAAQAAQSREENRALMFAAVAGLLRTAALQRPLMLMVDDLQWADKPTLLMLKYLLLNQPVALVLGTYRSTELVKHQPLTELLTELRREAGVEQIELSGLRGGDVVKMAEAVAEERLDPAGVELVQSLGEETNGNPYFLAEILRNLKDAGGVSRAATRTAGGDSPALDVPRSVRDAIASRVARMGERTDQVLGAGAVIGREFDIELLARILREDEEQLVDVLDAAVDAALISEVPGIGMRYSFVHPLIPPTLYEQLGGGSRRRLHRRALEGLEQLLGEEARAQRSGELAHHALAAVPMVDAAKAVDYARQAGQHALEQLAPQEALRWFGHAIELDEPGTLSALSIGEREARRCELLIGRGIAEQQSGDAAFRETLLEASRLAERLGDTERLVRAVLANTRGFVSETGRVDAERVAMLEAALEACGGDDGAARARLLAILSAELTFSGDWQRRKALSDESLAIATRLGDPATVSQVLSARFMTTWTPETLRQRLADTDRELAIAQELGDPLAQFLALHWKAAAAVEAGELDLAAELVQRESAVAQRLRQPTSSWLAAYDRATQALMHGLLDEAERSAEDAWRIATESEQPEALAFYAGQLVNIRFEQGRLGELEPLIAQQVEANPGIPAFRAALVLARSEAGMSEEAQEVLAIDSGTDFAELPYDPNWLTGLAIYAQAVADLDEPEAAAKLHRLLTPWRDHVAFNSATTWGLVERHLGNLARVLDRDDDAEQLLVHAADRHERMGAPVWLARTRLDLGRLLIKRGIRVSSDNELLEQALRTARDLGCEGIERRATELLEGFWEAA